MATKKRNTKAEDDGRKTAETKITEVDTDRIAYVIEDVQHQLRALVYLARTDTIEEPSEGETLRIVCEELSIRAHVMLDECLIKMGSGHAGNFADSFQDLDERRRVASEYQEAHHE